MSFISEHTCEYYLLSELVPFLSQYFEKVIPFYYWGTREGSSSLNRYKSSESRLLVIYPRRPKIIDIESQVSFLKFNEFIFPTIQYYKENQTAIIAGSPKAFSLFELNWKEPTCYWFEFLATSNKDVEYQINTEINLSNSSSTVKIITKEHIYEMLKDSKFRNWDETVKTIAIGKQYTYMGSGRRIFGWFGNYKPIFIVATS